MYSIAVVGAIVLMLRRYVDALFYSIDGNFRQNVRNKAMDKDDVALTRGAGYFASTEDFQRYVKYIGKPEEEVSGGTFEEEDD